MKLKIWMMIVCPLFLWVSCADNSLIDEYSDIANRSWSYDDTVRFDVVVRDTQVPYHIYLNIRHGLAYKYSNLFFMFHQHSPDGQVSSERTELTLAAPDGRWLGKGGNSLYNFQQLIKESYRFPDTGKYTILIEQNMRENSLEEIAGVGLRIVPAE